MRPWAMLVGLAVVLALAFCQFTNRPLVSAIVSAIVATGAFQLLVRAQLGYADELWPIAAAVSFGATFAVSLAGVLARRRFGRS